MLNESDNTAYVFTENGGDPIPFLDGDELEELQENPDPYIANLPTR